MVRANVPPNLLPVVDAARLDQQLDEIVELRRRLEFVGDSRAREAFEDLRANAHQTRFASEPERRARREREEVREEITNLVVERDGDLAIDDADVNMQAEDQIRARDVLKVRDDFVVALVRRDVLRLPIAEWMRGRGDDAKAALLREVIQLAAHLGELGLHLVDVFADARSDFDDGLVHFHTHALT